MNGLQHFWRPPGETREPRYGIADPTPQFHSKGFNAPLSERWGQVPATAARGLSASAADSTRSCWRARGGCAYVNQNTHRYIQSPAQNRGREGRGRGRGRGRGSERQRQRERETERERDREREREREGREREGEGERRSTNGRGVSSTWAEGTCCMRHALGSPGIPCRKAFPES